MPDEPRSRAHHSLRAKHGTVHTGYFDKSLPPVLTIESGDTVTLETLMLMDDQLRPGLSLEEIADLKQPYARQGRSTHSLTGPIYVKGAAPGDVLAVHIRRIVLRPVGVHYVQPGRAGAGTLPECFAEGHVMPFRWGPGAEAVEFAPGIRIPLRPFLGVMAVAPGSDGETNAVAPASHGGNMDLKELVEGTSIYLPVFVPGALFSAGDAHAAQGDGEVSGTALESAASEVELEFAVRRDLQLERPLAETRTHWITMGFHPDLDEAAKMAVGDAIRWIVRISGLTLLDAYSLCCLAVDLRVTQLVDRNKGIHAMIPKSLFGGAAPAGGLP